MEHINLINRIIEAENKAQEMAEAAKEKRRSLQADLQEAVSEVHSTFMERAEKRIDKVRRREESAAQDLSESIDEQFKKDLNRIEEAFEQNRDEWIEKLFSMVVRRR